MLFPDLGGYAPGETWRLVRGFRRGSAQGRKTLSEAIFKQPNNTLVFSAADRNSTPLPVSARAIP